MNTRLIAGFVLSLVSACHRVAPEPTTDVTVMAEDAAADGAVSLGDAATDELRDIDPFSPPDPSKLPWELDGYTKFEPVPNRDRSTAVSCDRPCRRVVAGLLGYGNNQICRRGDWLWFHGGTSIARGNIVDGRLELFSVARPPGNLVFLVGGIACTTEAIVVGFSGTTSVSSESFASLAVLDEHVMDAKTFWTRTYPRVHVEGIFSLVGRGRSVAAHFYSSPYIALLTDLRAEPVAIGAAPETASDLFLLDARSVAFGVYEGNSSVASIDRSQNIRLPGTPLTAGGNPTGDERYVAYSRLPAGVSHRIMQSEMVLRDRRSGDERVLSTSPTTIEKLSPFVAGDWVVWVEIDVDGYDRPSETRRSIWAHRISTGRTERLISGMVIRHPFIMDGKVYFQLETLDPARGWENNGLYETALPE
jgi:hypothetical protein